MSRELSRNQRRLAAIAAFGVFWGAFLVTIGFGVLLVVIVVGGLVGAAAIGLQGRRVVPLLRLSAWNEPSFPRLISPVRPASRLQL